MNITNTIYSIVTRLPPAIDGVGDYSLNLARQLRQDFGIETHFIVGDTTWKGATEIEGFPVSKLTSHLATNLVSLLPSNCQHPIPVLLHYVGYGYAKKGCPFWLVEGLQAWKNQVANTRLITMFHETYAFGAPWNSVFWLSPLQKNLAARLTRLSDMCITSKQSYAKTLEKLSFSKQNNIPTLPVFSTIGEPNQVPLLTQRSRRLVVFGQPPNRRKVYQKSLATLTRTCQELEIKEIWDVGPPTGMNLTEINGFPVVSVGQITPLEISTILLNSIAGFFNYPTEYLAKSTIFAAYCAHGLIPIGTFSYASSADGIEPGKHYWLADHQKGSLTLAEAQTIADNAYNWYQTHNLSAQAKVFFAYLRNHPINLPKSID